jgi:hypothetical protein
LASGGTVDRSLFSLDDFESVHMTSRLIVAQAYAYGCNRVVYTVKPMDEVIILDPVNGHAICGMAKIDGIAPWVEDRSRAALWREVANCVWWDGSPMYDNEGYTHAPPGGPDSGPAAILREQFKSRQYLLPGELKMLLTESGWDCPTAWLIG